MAKIRFGSFNVENLFTRARVFNILDKSIGDDVLDAIDKLDKLLRKDNYTAADKQEILQLFTTATFNGKTLDYFIEIREDRGKLFTKQRNKVTGVKAGGAGDWDGAIEHRRAPYNEMARENTAKVIKALNADVTCIIEAENRISLESFNKSMLDSKKFDYTMVIDGNDNRGIDVGLLSKFPILGIETHIYDGTSRSRIFSRDCLEVKLEMPNGKPMYILCNHLKSRGYGSQASNDSRREKQAKRLAEILGKYNLDTDYVVVAGDLNDSPDRPPHTLRPLLKLPNLYNVLALQFPNDAMKRWTYHYRGQFEQIDYILVSKPFKDIFVAAGVERRGIHKLKALTNGAETEYNTVTHWTNQASDHGGIWAEFDLT